MPRDFTRKGLLGDDMRLRPPGALAEVDFSTSVRLDQLGSVTASNRIVLRVHLRDGPRHQVPQHWRGATLDDFDGTQWYAAPESRVLAGRRWKRARQPGTWKRGNSPAITQVAVERIGDLGDRLPVPLSAQRMHVVQASERANVRPALDCTFRTRGRSPRRYDLDLAPDLGHSRRPPRIGLNALTHTTLRPGAVPAAASELAHSLRRALPANASQADIVDRVRDHMAANFDYLPPGADGGAESLQKFLSTARGGHCEYFASAMVVVLRTLNVPCRLVTGYRSDEWGQNRDVLIIRSRHAHAWVEVFDLNRGWRTVDPTPPADSDEALARLGLWTRIRYRMSTWWDRVMGFNATAAGSVRAWVLSIPGMVRRRPLPVAGLTVALVALVLILRRLRRPLRIPAVHTYERVLRRLGVALDPGETPRELLARVELEEPGRELLVAATHEHERERYSESGVRTSATRVTPGFGSS